MQHYAVCPCVICVQDDLNLFKADIDSAFRRIPVSTEHRQFAWVAIKLANETRLYIHNAMPFGSRASVDHWERTGDLCLLYHV